MPTTLSSNLMTPVLARIDADFNAAVDRLCTLLRIPSISTDPEHTDDCKAAADWLASDLASIGFTSAVKPTSGHPMVVAHYKSPVHSTHRVPTILYYGHYDVQPPDPVDLWESPPFQPTIISGAHGQRIVARGAVDDKGQLMTFIEAFRAWKLVHGSLPVNITIMLEGEEESGSPSLDPFLRNNKSSLNADVCIVCDTGMWDIDTPAITTQLRGLVYTEVTLHGPSCDLHSGMYGGAVVNPINALVSVLAQLHDRDRRIQVAGFYDGIIDPSPAELAQWKSLGFDEDQFLASIGLRTPFGESGRSTLERTWSRPTCDINGIYGGYTGKGAKTVIASHATAKVSFRLVPGQDPQRIYDNFCDFLNKRTPPDCRWEIKSFGTNPAIRVPTDSAWLGATRDGLRTVFNKQPVLIGSGGSIPVVGSIRKLLGFDSLLIGFGLDDDRVHSPNEKFELRCFRNGIKSHAAILDALARLSPP